MRIVTHLLRGCYAFTEHFFPSSMGGSALGRDRPSAAKIAAERGNFFASADVFQFGAP